MRSHSAIKIAIFAISSPAGVDVSMPSSTLTKAQPIEMSSSMNRHPLPAVRKERSPRKMMDGVEPLAPGAVEDLVDNLAVLGGAADPLFDEAGSHVPAASFHVAFDRVAP